MNKTLKRFNMILRKHIKIIILITIISIIIDIAEIARPYIVEQVLDNYLVKGAFVNGNISLVNLAILYIVVVIVGNVLDYINRCISCFLGENVLYEIRAKLFNFIDRANLTFHDKTPSGKLYVRVTADTEDIYALFTDVITTFPKDIIYIIGLIGMMIYISTKLSIINFVMIFLLVVISVILTRKMNKIFERNKVERTKLNTFLAESIYGIKIIKIFNRHKEKQKECEKRTQAENDSIKNLGLMFGLLPGSITILENVAIAFIVIFCTYHFMGIDLEVGVIYLFISYLRQIIDPIDRIIENMEIVTDAFTSIDKVYDILEQEDKLEDFDSGIQIGKIKGKIEFKNVWFAYEKDNWILKDVSFVINPGESAALVGKTGSGKTTITSLICRFYDIQKGEILIDGVNIKDINLKSLRDNIGVILQNPFIFSRSIKDNIKLYADVSDEDVEKAVKLASAVNFIRSLPNGLDEISKELGNSYSAGQKQLLAFSRIFANDPSIFVLDEATANIDTITEGFIQKSIDKLSKDRTSIFIAHRLATIVNVDKIIVLDQGSIVEVGSHNELVKKSGYYSKLYKAYYTSLSN